MKILYYFADKKTFMSQWQHEHIFDELYHHGVYIDVFNPLVYNSLDEANDKLLQLLKNNPGYDLFMNCCSSKQLHKETMANISKLPIPTLLICFDNLHAAYIHEDIMPYFDLVWLTSKENEESIRKHGVNTHFAPYAANPYKFVPHSSNDILKVCFIGTPYGTRTTKINILTSNEIPVDVFFGSKDTTSNKSSNVNNATMDFDTLSHYLATNIGRKLLYSRFLACFNKTILDTTRDCYTRAYSLPFDEMISCYSDYALSLNVIELRNTYLLKTPIHKLHLRTFEIPMCGGIEFTSYNKELAEYFEEDKEIVFYRSEEEYIDKARFYLKEDNSSLRKAIRASARRRAENEHTWWLRFSEIFKKLNT